MKAERLIENRLRRMSEGSGDDLWDKTALNLSLIVQIADEASRAVHDIGEKAEYKAMQREFSSMIRTMNKWLYWYQDAVEKIEY